MDLLEQYVPRLYRFALRLTNDHHAAEDLTQESVLRAWKYRDRLREPQPSITWLFRIAVNAWRDHVRRQRHPVSLAKTLDEDLEANTIAPDRLASGQDELQRALDAMQSLPARQRQVLHLHVCEGLACNEIASVLAISRASVKSNLALARKRMREIFADRNSAPCEPFGVTQ